MIRHLNPMSFQGFGTILPERRHGVPPADIYSNSSLFTLSAEDSVVYVCQEPVVLQCEEGTAILSVCADGSQVYQDYYLDKPVRLAKNICFSLSALRGNAAARVTVTAPLQTLGFRTRSEDLSIRHLLHAKSLYTFFYHEKEQAFLFAGESHPMLELTYVDQGSMHSVADGLDILMEQGDMVLYGPNQWHMQYADIGVAPRYVTVSFDIDGSDLSSLYNRKFKAPQKAVTLLQQMLREQERMDRYSGDMLLSLLTQLLLTLLRESACSEQKLQSSHALHSENDIIRRAQQYITENIRCKLSVPLVSSSVDISPSYLTALFHKHLQISPGEYIRRIKLQESKQMIREDAMNFTEIAAALQYSTVHHFSRQFKEKFGITPTEYAKSVR